MAAPLLRGWQMKSQSFASGPNELEQGQVATEKMEYPQCRSGVMDISIYPRRACHVHGEE